MINIILNFIKNKFINNNTYVKNKIKKYRLINNNYIKINNQFRLLEIQQKKKENYVLFKKYNK